MAVTAALSPSNLPQSSTGWTSWSTITSKRTYLHGNFTVSPSLRHLALHNNTLCIKALPIISKEVVIAF